MIICWVYHYKELILHTGSHVSHWWSQNTDKKNATYLPEYTKHKEVTSPLLTISTANKKQERNALLLTLHLTSINAQSAFPSKTPLKHNHRRLVGGHLCQIPLYTFSLCRLELKPRLVSACQMIRTHSWCRPGQQRPASELRSHQWGCAGTWPARHPSCCPCVDALSGRNCGWRRRRGSVACARLGLTGQWGWRAQMKAVY